MFDEDHHEPFDIAEPDKNYETNMIKSIVKEGFLIEENGKSYIINPVSVIVVNND
jgi:molecular chaperone GrpE (heat shock protein)